MAQAAAAIMAVGQNREIIAGVVHAIVMAIIQGGITTSVLETTVTARGNAKGVQHAATNFRDMSISLATKRKCGKAEEEIRTNIACTDGVRSI